MMNLNQTPQTQIQLLPRNNRLDVAYETIDELHTAISEGQLDNLQGFDSRLDLLNWLRDVIYTAQETIEELESNQPSVAHLRVVSNTNNLIVLEKAD
jgi:hypothetical protein